MDSGGVPWGGAGQARRSRRGCRPPPAASSPVWVKSPFFRSLLYTGARRNPATGGTNQGSETGNLVHTDRGAWSTATRCVITCVGQIAFFQVLALYRRSPESGGWWCKSRHLKRLLLRAGGREVVNRHPLRHNLCVPNQLN